jgi:Carboxypeptidase regulatory-like domain/TonB-dependent Receptor Plug Domain
MTKKYLSTSLLCFFICLCFTWCLAAQSIVTGGLTGTVTDPSGAVVSGAKITINNPATGESQSTTTSSVGEYRFALLKPGTYDLTIAMQGFKNVTQKVVVILGQTSTASVALELGAGATTVEVTGENNAQIETENADVTTNFSAKQLAEIPNPGNDLTYIAQTAPGATMNSAAGGGYGNFSTFGLPATANLFTMNGNDYNDPFLNLNNSGSSNLLLGANEVQQVEIVNNGYSGQYGRQVGATVDYSTKSGTNAFHGDALYDWTGRYLNANDPINKATSPVGGPINERPFTNNNQWAASLGGPIIKDKVFFFLNNEGLRYIFGSIKPVTVPTPAFENYVLGNLPSVTPAGQLPQTVAFYQNAFKLWNAAPQISHATPNASSCSSAGLPASINGDQCTESWDDSVSSGNKEWLISGRIDIKINDDNQIFGRAKFDRGVQPTYTDAINPLFNTFSNQPQNEGQVNYTHVFSPTVVNDFIASILYYSAIFGSVNSNSPALSAFPGVLNFTDGAVTSLGFGSGVGGYASGFLFPQGRNVTQYGFVDDLSVTRGNHAMKMGFNFRRDDVSDFTASEVTVFPGVNTTLSSFANNTLGPAGSFTQYNFTATPVQPVAIYTLGLYFQDTYKVDPKLTLTLTMRVDRNSGGACQHACASRNEYPFADTPHGADLPYNQSFPTGFTSVAPSVEFAVFQPRFGLAWTPWGSKTVIRTGVGLFSDLYPGTALSLINTNFPQVNLWEVPGGTLAWDLKPPGSTAFPTSGVSIVQGCNSTFVNNYHAGGNLASYQAAAPTCTATGAPGGTQLVPNYSDITNKLLNPKYVEWNIEIQHQLGNSAIFDVNYVGNYGYDELYYNPYPNSFGYGSLPATVPDPRVGRVSTLYNGAVSNYNGITVSLRSNNWHGMTASVGYTLSHALDEISNGGILPFSIYYSVAGPLSGQINPYNLRSQYASADYDARHQVTGNYLYAIPFKSSNRFLNFVAGGWQWSGTLFYRTGFPFSVFDNATTSALVSNNLQNGTILLQPEFSQRTFQYAGQFINKPAFGVAGGQNSTAPFLFAPANGNFTGPTVGRNAFRGPGFVGGDMSLRKNFKITERVAFQLGLNAYNWFNHANYGAPYPGTALGPTFGETIFTQTPPTSPYGAFAQAATDMRIAQITGKITF